MINFYKIFFIKYNLKKNEISQLVMAEIYKSIKDSVHADDLNREICTETKVLMEIQDTSEEIDPLFQNALNKDLEDLQKAMESLRKELEKYKLKFI
jgi:hypothetical protein